MENNEVIEIKNDNNEVLLSLVEKFGENAIFDEDFNDEFVH